MWLLQTTTATLTQFADISAVPGGYAILSHTWKRSGEQSFRELQDIIRRCKKDDSNARDHVSEKIESCCIQAEKDGYEWVWIDTCCIDKDSSTELSEAINSMFTWYLHAEVCYAYLSDVPSRDHPRDWLYDFIRARWHSRGWTLQELLAPALVVFFSADWEVIGTKDELANILSVITAIPSSVLTRQTSIFSLPIATRMTWAAHRETTRIEDEAYCLLGIFDINMPTLYGEGARAFYRLQQEIAKQSPDTTLFAWGDRHTDREDKIEMKVEVDHLSAESSRDLNIWEDASKHFLFAPSPRNFRYVLGASMSFTPRVSGQAVLQPYTVAHCSDREDGKTRSAVGPFGPGYDLPSFEMTNLGMKCCLPLAEVNGHTIAVLFCETNRDHVGLLLNPVSPDHACSRQTYHVGARCSFPSKYTKRYIRVVHLGADFHNLSFRGTTFRAAWREFYIATAPPIASAHSILGLASDRVPGIPFRIPRWLFRVFTGLELFPESTITTGADGPPVKVVRFANTNNFVNTTMILVLGTLRAFLDMSVTNHSGAVRADGLGAHACPDDHVAFWPGWTREFEASHGVHHVRLSFSRCPHDPAATRVLHAELRTALYPASVVVPPRVPLSAEDRAASERSREEKLGSTRAMEEASVTSTPPAEGGRKRAREDDPGDDTRRATRFRSGSSPVPDASQDPGESR
ncbi:HET-domain-containing protein [Epithele typhae]|uniref:HET-domain-containing protein n=1 Tax=Epithele typhae TaxID=378194 RepID=UPI0020077706|nr:HET-domain-containing protein [Epithele typhae]KAH9927920.1 HET-domain-containing protein [Epithele typhae]